MLKPNDPPITDCCKQLLERLLAPITWTIFFLGCLERLFQANHVFAWPQAVECLCFTPELFVGIVSRLDRQSNTTLCFIDLDDSSFDFLAYFEDILDLGDMLFAELRNVY